MTVECGTIRADNFTFIPHVEKYMRMIKWRFRSNALEFFCANLYRIYADVIVKIGYGSFRHLVLTFGLAYMPCVLINVRGQTAVDSTPE